jgi:hypothetical protein
MALKKFVMLMVMITVTSLVYIQMHVNIYSLAYDGKQKEKEIFKIVDMNSYIIYNIAKLKSAQHLGVEILKDQSDIVFSGSEQIVRVEVSRFDFESNEGPSQDLYSPQPSFLASLFALRSEAEAHPIR